MFAGLEYGQDSGMLQFGEGSHFETEAFSDTGCAELVRQQHFQGDGAARVQLFGAIDDAHAAPGNFTGQLVSGHAQKGAGGPARWGLMDVQVFRKTFPGAGRAEAVQPVVRQLTATNRTIVEQVHQTNLLKGSQETGGKGCTLAV